jgi:hypothetical protein
MTAVSKYASNLLKDPELRFYNLQSGSEADVTKMLNLVRAVVQPRYRDELPSIESMVLTDNDGFDIGNPGDFITLLFEAVVRVNHNPELWHIQGAGGAAGEINTTINNFSHGPSPMAGRPADGVKATTYSDALKQLTHIMTNRSPF